MLTNGTPAHARLAATQNPFFCVGGAGVLRGHRCPFALAVCATCSRWCPSHIRREAACWVCSTGCVCFVTWRKFDPPLELVQRLRNQLSMETRVCQPYLSVFRPQRSHYPHWWRQARGTQPQQHRRQPQPCQNARMHEGVTRETIDVCTARVGSTLIVRVTPSLAAAHRLVAYQPRLARCALPTSQVMATAFSNVAADNLLEGVLRLGMRAVRIGRPATVRPTLWHATLDALVENHPDVVGESFPMLVGIRVGWVSARALVFEGRGIEEIVRVSF